MNPQGRDPQGWVERKGQQWIRYITSEAEPLYTETLELQAQLSRKNYWLLAGPARPVQEGLYAAELPPLAFHTYPWEWSWKHWKEAALTTLSIQREALAAGFTLQDATPLNLTLERGHMRWFDQLSLGRYQEGSPWAAYGEFVSSFLAPLLLMAWCDRRLVQLLSLYPQGLPLDLTYTLLPKWRQWHPTALLHLRLPARRSAKIAKPSASSSLFLSKKRLLGLLQSLEADIQNLSPRYAPSAWQGYADTSCPYPPEAQSLKKDTIHRWAAALQPKWALDAGAHTGVYTHLIGKHTSEGLIALEHDPVALDTLAEKAGSLSSRLYPVWVDIAIAPSSFRWAGMHLPGLQERLQAKVDLVLALALIHHLRLRNLLSFPVQASLFAGFLPVGGHLAIEYVAPEDPQIPWLHTRPYIFPDYSETGFLAAFSSYFRIVERVPIPGMHRTLFLMKKHTTPSAY